MAPFANGLSRGSTDPPGTNGGPGTGGQALGGLVAGHGRGDALSSAGTGGRHGKKS